MPTYEYRCDQCGHEFEVSQRITEDPVDTCSKCGGQVRRLINATNFILKGDGWYKTDYAPSSGGQKAEADAGCSADKSSPQCKTCPANTD
ncbi:MAG: zinc ribbon domain-containing protein [bacterium]|nr:MAG: zinc ribbon domain-containing protein [bacterium]